MSVLGAAARSGSGFIITVAPWVAGMRATAYHTGIHLTHVVQGKSWEEGIDEILASAEEKARKLGCNALVGLEIACDPYHRPGGRIELSATGAAVVPL